MKARKIIIVGGVAGGASCATRARRLSEESEIIIFEKGPHVSFANCGLPYFAGGEIAERDKLLVQTPESLQARFNLDVRVSTHVMRIDRERRAVEVRNLNTGEEYWEGYDALVLSTGARPLIPPIPGIGRAGHFAVRNVPDADHILAWVSEHSTRNAVVVGGGFIGLEMAEQLRRRGMMVSLVEAMPQVMAPLDTEMAAWLHNELLDHGVHLYLGNPVSSFEDPAEEETAAASVVVLQDGQRVPADIVILGLGVKPETTLASEAGLKIGELGGIRVTKSLHTSDPHIWAVGDAIEVTNALTGEWSLIPLAGPANRQGRIVANNILGRPVAYEGTLGSSIVRVFDIAAGATGLNEKTARRLKIDYEVIHLHPQSHAGYFPGAEPIALKILFDPGTGKLLGAQAAGRDGVDKRIDVLATALKGEMHVHDLANLELAYAPPYGSAKDPVNLAGMAAMNVIAGDTDIAQWHEITDLDFSKTILLDVRESAERERGRIPNSIHIPLDELRGRFEELPRDKEVVVYCHSGQRSYYAARILSQHGYRARNLTGAWRTWEAMSNGHLPREEPEPDVVATVSGEQIFKHTWVD
ncbi:MAG: FAD-dependent oxidoreductase [Planctomycetota bacterium]|jgi:NADPH-dependent 2,4-dienoyl-CoA reductase/sulfur reductase-like enzyme/rhodanese-related sulfurtransferase|nr:FAD-dependent oxidoreductase [Planctomycetota bacterium]